MKRNFSREKRKSLNDSKGVGRCVGVCSTSRVRKKVIGEGDRGKKGEGEVQKEE